MVTKLHRCKVCGDGMIVENAPDRCPFCGALGENIVLASEYNETFIVDLTDTEKEDVKTALNVELSNAAFYLDVSKKSEDEEISLLFKTLKKVEAEHASVWSKLLQIKKPELHDDKALGTDEENLRESHRREERAVKFYKEAYKRTTNERMKFILSAIILAEEDHLTFSDE